MKLSSVHHPTSDPIDELTLCRWVGSAMPGDTLEYHRGHLALERTTGGKLGDTAARRALVAIANRALDLAGRGLVRLVQRRHGPHDYSYFVVASCSSRHGTGPRLAPSEQKHFALNTRANVAGRGRRQAAG